MQHHYSSRSSSKNDRERSVNEAKNGSADLNVSNGSETDRTLIESTDSKRCWEKTCGMRVFIDL